ncbi:MAG: hypothetical protein ABI432_11995 [Flavobacteriales bacterium]
MRKRTVLGSVIIIAAVALGAVRDFLFVNLNYQIDAVEHRSPISYAHSLFRAAVAGLDLNALNVMKWGLAMLYILLMLTAGIALSRVLFGDHRYRRPLVIGTAAIALISLALHRLAVWNPALEGVSIALSHAIQYPVPLLFICAASWSRPAQQPEASTTN